MTFTCEEANDYVDRMIKLAHCDLSDIDIATLKHSLFSAIYASPDDATTRALHLIEQQKKELERRLAQKIDLSWKERTVRDTEKKLHQARGKASWLIRLLYLHCRMITMMKNKQACPICNVKMHENIRHRSDCKYNSVDRTVTFCELSTDSIAFYNKLFTTRCIRGKINVDDSGA